MWWLTLPVIVYSAGLLVLWVIVVRRSDGGSEADRGSWKMIGAQAALKTDSSPGMNEALCGSDMAGLPKISVVVSSRNEEKQLPALMESLVCQDYPPELFEVIIVNDNSTDRMPVVVSEFIAGKKDLSGPRMRLIYNPSTGKKKAVRYGIEKASGDVIMTTDADCIVGSGWIRSHARWYREGVVSMVLAPVVQRHAEGFWSLFGAYEFSALQAITEATAVAGYPVMCNAANMSFRREVYLCHADELRSDLPSGDDMFLLEAVMRGGRAVRHDGRSAAVVVTAGAVTAAALLRQRTRWASKAIHLKSPLTLTLAAATAACSAAVTTAAVAACVTPVYILLAGVMYGLKALPDYLLISLEMHRRGNRVRVLPFIVSELIYPFWFIVVAVASLLPGAGRFRGR